MEGRQEKEGGGWAREGEGGWVGGWVEEEEEGGGG